MGSFGAATNSTDTIIFSASSFFGGINQPSGFGCGDHYFQHLVFLPPFVSLLVLAGKELDEFIYQMNSSNT
jgi:hypothetical protein